MLKKSIQSTQLRWFLASLTILLSGIVLIGFIQGVSRMRSKSYKGRFPPLSETEKNISANLRQHVYTLAGEIGERNIWLPEKLHAARTYIEQTWQQQNYKVTPQVYDARGVLSANLEIEIPGGSHPEEIVLVGAHYDSVLGSPGANDNGTGVAALLEISRLLQNNQPARTVRLVAFVNEEPPFFLRKDMGSKVYAARASRKKENIVGMLSLETMGSYSERPHSQGYPFPFSLFYPHTANFIGFVGNMKSRKLVMDCLGSFRTHTMFPSEGAAVPGWITGIGWSDHWSFWREGYRAIMVTDTALFRYDHYHTREDTPEKIDYSRLARVTGGLARVIADIADRQ